MIWGASGGIGRALVEDLVPGGWTVWAIARTPGNLRTLTPYVVQADVSEERAVQRAAMAVSEAAAVVDLWVYAIGDIIAAKVAEMSPRDWQRVLDVNLPGACLATIHSLPLLAQNAHLFFLGAVSEQLRLPRLSAYAASKAGLESCAEALRKEERGRLVTVVRPKAVDTALWRKVPFERPRRSLSPHTVARQIVKAYHGGHKGTLDL